MAKLRPTQFFNHTKEKALSSKQCVEIFTEVVFAYWSVAVNVDV